MKEFAKLFVYSDGKSPNYKTLKNHIGDLPSEIADDLRSVVSAKTQQKSNK